MCAVWKAFHTIPTPTCATAWPNICHADKEPKEPVSISDTKKGQTNLSGKGAALPYQLFIILISLLAPFPGGSVSAQSAMQRSGEISPNNQEKISSSCDNLNRPRDASQLLINIKEVFLDGCLLQDGFFSDKNLLNVFGGGSVQRSPISRSEYLIKVESLSGLLAQTDSHPHLGMEIWISKSSSDRLSSISIIEKATAVLATGHDPSINMEFVQNIFGAADVTEPPTRADVPLDRDPPVLGGPTWRYDITARGYSSICTMSFNRDGTLRAIGIGQHAQIEATQ